jgi:O-antigen/teichoic acid export membrane protein
LAIGVFHGLSQQVFLIATVESRSRGESLHFARQNLERAGIALAIGCGIGVLLESATAVLFTEAIVSFLLTLKTMRGVLQRSRIKVTVVARLAVRRLGEIRWSSAMALLAVMFVSFSYLNADRWLAAQLLRPTAFALYSFAWILLLVAQSLQSLINASFFPLLARRYASAGSSAAFGLCARASIGLLLACALVSWPTGWLLNAVVLRWFPSYAESTSVMGIFLWVAALRISDFWGSYLIIVGREKRLLLVYLAVGIVVCVSWTYKVQPWANAAIAIADVAWLAVALTFVGYLASFLTAWSARRL